MKVHIVTYSLHTGFTIPPPTEASSDVKTEKSTPKPLANKSSSLSPAASSVKLTPTSSSSKLGAGTESLTPKSRQSSQSADKKEDKLGKCFHYSRKCHIVSSSTTINALKLQNRFKDLHDESLFYALL